MTVNLHLVCVFSKYDLFTARTLSLHDIAILHMEVMIKMSVIQQIFCKMHIVKCIFFCLGRTEVV